MRILCLGMYGLAEGELSYEMRMIHHLAQIPGNEVDYWTDAPLSYAMEPVLKQPPTLRSFVFKEGKNALAKTPRQFHPIDVKRIIHECYPYQQEEGPVQDLVDPGKYDIIFTTSQTGIDMGVWLKQVLGIPLVVQILDCPYWRLDQFGPWEIYKESVVPLPLLPQDLFNGYRGEWGWWFSNLDKVDRVTTILEVAKENLAAYAKAFTGKDYTDKISVSYHGCFSPDTQIITDRGLRTISSIVNTREPVQVACYSNGFVQFSPILKYFKHSSAEGTIRIDTGAETIEATLENPIFTDKGWVPAQNIKEGMRVHTIRDGTRNLLGTVDRTGAYNTERKLFVIEHGGNQEATSKVQLRKADSPAGTAYGAQETESGSLQTYPHPSELVGGRLSLHSRSNRRGGLDYRSQNETGASHASRRNRQHQSSDNGLSESEDSEGRLLYSATEYEPNMAQRQETSRTDVRYGHQSVLIIERSQSIPAGQEAAIGTGYEIHPVNARPATEQRSIRGAKSLSRGDSFVEQEVKRVTRISNPSYNSVYDLMTVYGNFLANNIVVHNSIDCDTFDYYLQKEKVERKQQVLCLNRIDFHKGVDQTVLVCKHIQDLMGDKAPEFVFASRGNQDWYENLVKDFARQQLRKVRFTGWIDNPTKIRLIRESKVVIDNEWPEGFGGCILGEAIYSGTQPLAWNRRSKKEVHPQGANLIEKGDFKSMAERAAYYLAGDYEETPQDARDFIRQFRSNKSHAESINKILQETLGR